MTKPNQNFRLLEFMIGLICIVIQLASTSGTPTESPDNSSSLELSSTSPVEMPIAPPATDELTLHNAQADSTARFRDFLQNYNLTDCYHDIEASYKQWINVSQNAFNEYLKDENKTLQCNKVTPVPHAVLQAALDSYSALRNRCEIVDSIGDELRIQMKFEMTLESAVSLKQRILQCMDRSYCLPSGKTLQLVYVENNLRSLKFQAASGKPNPNSKSDFRLSVDFTHSFFQAQGTCFVNGSLYAVGVGFLSSQMMRLTNGKWEGLRLLPTTQRRGHCVVSIGNKIYAVGGNMKYHSYLRINKKEPILSYNIDTNVWSQKSYLEYQVNDAVCVTYKHLIYVFGDLTTVYREQKFIQIYNTVNDTVLVDTNPIPDGYFYEAVVWRSKILLFGAGEHAVFDLESNFWEDREPNNYPHLISYGIQRNEALTIDDDVLYSMEMKTDNKQDKRFFEIRAIPVVDFLNRTLSNGWKPIAKAHDGLDIHRVLKMHTSPCEDV